MSNLHLGDYSRNGFLTFAPSGNILQELAWLTLQLTAQSIKRNHSYLRKVASPQSRCERGRDIERVLELIGILNASPFGNLAYVRDDHCLKLSPE